MLTRTHAWSGSALSSANHVGIEAISGEEWVSSMSAGLSGTEFSSCKMIRAMVKAQSSLLQTPTDKPQSNVAKHLYEGLHVSATLIGLC